MSSNSTITNNKERQPLFVTYYPLVLVIMGTIFNLLTFTVLCRPFFRNTVRQPTMHYLRAIAIFDILMLYGWNFDHYLWGAYGYTLLTYSIESCKLLSFLNYFAAQSSAWIRVFVCLDRYLSLRYLRRPWFCQSYHVLFIISCVIAVFSILNLPLVIFACYFQANGQISIFSRQFRIYPLWDYINLGVYNCTPCILMIIFNSGVIHRLIYVRRTTAVPNSRNQHRSVSITLVITTFLFSLMTIPGTVAYAFFTTASPTILHLLDSMLYTYHITSFPLYFLVFGDFRREFLAMVSSSTANGRVLPAPVAILKTTPNRGIRSL